MSKTKLELLKDRIKQLKRVLVAFSGGVDSTFLLKVCSDALGSENVLAVTAASPIRLEEKVDKAAQIAASIGVKHEIIETTEIDTPEFADNNRLRCYYCKKHLFGRLKEVAAERGISSVLDGSNFDDFLSDDRPGIKALKEFEIISPLNELKLTKKEIRAFSRELKLPTWDQPSDTCLATRFSYDLQIEKEMLERLREIELYIRKFNFTQLRVRIHDKNTIRLEVLPAEMEKLMENREEIVKEIKARDFTYITLDLEGYRSGSMSEI